MALIKHKNRITRPLREETRTDERGMDGLLKQLASPDPMVRRLGAKDLGKFPDRAVDALADRLTEEEELAVREAIITSLVDIGGPIATRRLILLLRSEDTALRNSAMEALQHSVDQVEPHLNDMLADPDPDVRILTVNLIAGLTLPTIPQLLLKAATCDEHVNVVAAALDFLAEVGVQEMIPSLKTVKDRFPGEPFIIFSVDTVIRRIEG